MNKRFFIAWIVLFVGWLLGDFVVHAVLLEPDYMRLPNLYRTASDGQRYFPVMMLAHLIMAGAFVWIYARGVEAKPWVAQGVRFGVAAALLTAVPTYLIYYAVQPLPAGASYFAFFGLPQKLTIEPASLEGQFHMLSWKLHPDNFVRASEYERSLSLERSSQLNDAYRTLREPIARVAANRPNKDVRCALPANSSSPNGWAIPSSAANCQVGQRNP